MMCKRVCGEWMDGWWWVGGWGARRGLSVFFVLSCPYSASHFSHFLTYLSSNWAMSRTTNVSTTVAKNSDDRRSLLSMADRSSGVRLAYAGATGCIEMARECSSRSCACAKSRLSPWTYDAGESRLKKKKKKKKDVRLKTTVGAVRTRNQRTDFF